MIEIGNKVRCCGCAACEAACPAQCIRMEVDSEGFAYPEADAAACIGCGRCERVCPFLNASGDAPAIGAYAARTLDAELLHASSSGGVFTELCKPILNAGGVVYGVAMDADCRGCSFVRAESIDGIAPMRGSKYMQADSRGVYEQVAEDAKNGRKVLFSGTPCQVNALSLYLKGKRDGLLLVDCICHGVPSPRLWAESVADLEARKGAKVQSVNFRCKEISWQRFGLRAKYGDKMIFEPLDRSPYLRMFLKDYCLRESCYACEAKRTRAADITIADFWGVQYMLPEMSDEFGCSLVIARSEEGGRRLLEIAGSLEMSEVDYGVAVGYNRAAYASATRPPERDVFFSDLDALGYAGVARKYGTPDAKELAKRAAKGVLAKVGLLDTVKNLRGGGSSVSSFRYGILYSFNQAVEAAWGMGEMPEDGRQ